MNWRRRIQSRVPDGGKDALKSLQRKWALASAPLRVLPDFLIIGAQRCGTTSLYRYLTQHPGVASVTWGKGAHFFDTSYANGVTWYRSHFPTRAYVRLLARRGTPAAVGEASPYYLFHPLVPTRAAELLPDVRAIVLLRDPVARAYSHHSHEVARGFERLSFEEAIEREPERLAGEVERMRADAAYTSFAHQHHSYLSRGRYAEQLERWYAVVPRERVLVLESERFFADPDVGYRAVLEFLGLTPHSLREYETFNPRRYEPLRPETERRLREYFAAPNARLYELLGVDFGW